MSAPHNLFSTLQTFTLGKQLRQINPKLPVVLSTGYKGMVTEELIQGLGFRGLLVKPTTARALGEAVHSALQQAA